MRSFIIFLLFSMNTYAKIDCTTLDELRTKINVYSGNFLNAETTRSLDGGFYKKRVVQSCHGGKCQIIKVNRFKNVFLPNHPDADSKGYVKFPSIDKGQEYTLINKSVKELTQLAKSNSCNTKLLVHRKQKNLMKITYSDDPIADKFLIEGNNVRSWTVESPMGDNTIVFN